jgi:hypothetical protein
MNQSQLWETVVRNNNGVARLKHDNNYEGAITEFVTALELLRPHLSESFSLQGMIPAGQCEHFEQDEGVEVDSAAATKPTTSAQETNCTITTPLWRQTGENESYQCHPEVQQQSLDKPFLFNDPIEIPAQVLSKASSHTPKQQLLRKLFMVATHNLALAFHLSAVENACTTRLFRALTLYEFAFKVHLEESSHVTLLYSLALVNNLGLIYRQLNEEERSSQCFQHLLAIMMLLHESKESHKIKQWDGLVSNVLGLIFTDPAVAAAA